MNGKPKNWDDDATFGSDIHGTGSAWGNITGKVKTEQIGFVRGPRRQVRGKNGVSDKGRGKASPPRHKQK